MSHSARIEVPGTFHLVEQRVRNDLQTQSRFPERSPSAVMYRHYLGERGAGSVALTLHDVAGRAIRRLAGGPQLAGFHSVVWDGKDEQGRSLPAGVYFCRLQAGGTNQSKRVTLVR